MNEKKGFILLESLVSLAIISLLVLSVMGMVQNLNGIYAGANGSEYTAMTVRLTRNPRLHQTNPNLQLIKTKSLNVGRWNVYRYRTNEGTDKVTIFIPSESTK